MCQTDSVVERVPLNIKQIITVTHGSIIKKQRWQTISYNYGCTLRNKARLGHVDHFCVNNWFTAYTNISTVNYFNEYKISL